MYGALIIAAYFLAGSVLAAPEGDPINIFARAKCNADNCLRAIDGTRRGSSFAAAATEQCSAFLRTTFTPSHTTKIVSETTIVTLPTQYITVYVSASTPVLVPSYASACSGSVRYVSACSCAGITASTTTLPVSAVETTYTDTIYYTPTTTLTVTQSASSSYHYDSTSSYSYDSSSSSTYSYDSSSSYSSASSTSSSDPTPIPSCNTYELKATFQYSNFKDQFLELSQDYHFANTLDFTSDDTHESRFLFNLLPNGQFQGVDGTGVWVSELPSTNSSLIYQVNPSSPLNDNRYPVICHLVGGSIRGVVCTVNGYDTMLQTCGYDNSRLAQSTAGFQCTAVNLVAVPACNS